MCVLLMSPPQETVGQEVTEWQGSDDDGFLAGVEG